MVFRRFFNKTRERSGRSGSKGVGWIEAASIHITRLIWVFKPILSKRLFEILLEKEYWIEVGLELLIH